MPHRGSHPCRAASLCLQLWMKVFDQCMVGLAFLHLMMVSRQQHAAPGVLAVAMQLYHAVSGTSTWLQKHVHRSARTITRGQQDSVHPCFRTCFSPVTRRWPSWV